MNSLFSSTLNRSFNCRPLASANKLDCSEELQEQIEWELMENKRISRIAIFRKGSIDSDNRTLDEILNWSIDKMLKFKSTYGNSIQSISSSVPKL